MLILWYTIIKGKAKSQKKEGKIMNMKEKIKMWLGIIVIDVWFVTMFAVGLWLTCQRY